MRILLTGGAGFIGSHVAEWLLRDRHELAIIDDLNDSYPPEWKKQNIEILRAGGTFDFYLVDIRETARIQELVAAFQPDAVIHMAARSGVRPSLKQPLLYEQVNVHGTLGLLEACRLSGVRKLLFASSSSIYGVANQAPFREDDHCNFPISPYAATKLASEKLCFTYSHLYDLHITCLRLFTVYGPRQRPDLAIRKFTQMIDKGEPIPVFGDGSSGRDYTFVDDIVQGVLAALRHEARYEIFNLGNSHPVALSSLIAEIEEALGKRALIRQLPNQPGDVPITYADISKAQHILRYRPETPFTDGIRKFVAWYRATQR